MQTPPVSSDTILNQLQWRYATKKFDPKRKIPDAAWRALEQALVLSPSSYGLQPWKFFVVTNPQVRERLVHASWGQRQVADASHLVVFAVKEELNTTDVDRHIQRISQVRGVSAESLSGFRDMMLEFVTASGFDAKNWGARQAYIALGNLLTTAALLGIDTCPMEGFEAPRYDEILGLTEQGYAAAVVCAAGYRAGEDQYASLPKVRFEAKDVIARVE